MATTTDYETPDLDATAERMIQFLSRINIGGPVPVVPWLPSRFTRRHLHARNDWPWELRRIVEAVGLSRPAARERRPLLGRAVDGPGSADLRSPPNGATSRSNGERVTIAVKQGEGHSVRHSSG